MIQAPSGKLTDYLSNYTEIGSGSLSTPAPSEKHDHDLLAAECFTQRRSSVFALQSVYCTGLSGEKLNVFIGAEQRAQAEHCINRPEFQKGLYQVLVG